MKIKLSIQRPNGTVTTMPNGKGLTDTVYHFAPQADGEHVAEVTNEEHIAMFLRIPEYTPYGDLDMTEKTLVLQIAQAAPTQPPETVSGNQSDTIADEDAEPLAIDQMTRPMLMTMHELVMGEKAHPATKLETLRVKIMAEIGENATKKAIFDAEALRLGAAQFSA